MFKRTCSFPTTEQRFVFFSTGNFPSFYYNIANLMKHGSEKAERTLVVWLSAGSVLVRSLHKGNNIAEL